MDLTPKQQASEAIRQAEAILIVTGQRPNIDQVASVVALSLILRKFGKKVTTVITDPVPISAGFITEGNIEKSLTGLRDFIMHLDLSRAEVDKLKYTIENGKLNVHVIPFRGGFSQSDVTFAHGDYHYDLIIAMGVPSRSKLDRVLEQNPGLLAATPLLNIDYHRINENYGAINLIDTNAATLSEMLISLAESLQAGLLDETIATAMLAGIISSTDRFSAAHTTAKSMTVAAQLMAAGAKQQTIIKSLYGNRDGGRDGRDGRDSRDRRPERPVQASHQSHQPQHPAQPMVSEPAPIQSTGPEVNDTPPAAPTNLSSEIDWSSVMPSIATTNPLESSPEYPLPTTSDQADSDQLQSGSRPEHADEEGGSAYSSETSLNPNQA